MRWDLFCRVVDNLGDIGVCWRLARQLAAEHSIDVRLWVDDLASLARLRPGCAIGRQRQLLDGVEVVAWTDPIVEVEPGDALIEAFGCGVPAGILAASAKSGRAPVWINLEHLSAEAWTLGCHRLPSPHPSLPLTCWFYFPGFEPGSGGLIREAGLLDRRDAFRARPGFRVAGLAEWGIEPPSAGTMVVSLFCYASNPVSLLAEVLADGVRPVLCLVPEGVASEAVRDILGRAAVAGAEIRRGNLVLRVVPFRDQDAYDRLLWSCDLNFVRGEDSFVRAQWAGTPFVWGIYPQSDAAHRAKLDAFLRLYIGGSATQPAGSALADFWRSWNAGSCDPAPFRRDWEYMLTHLEGLRASAGKWADGQAARPDLASELVSFYRSRV